MKHRNFVEISKTITKIDKHIQSTFVLDFQKAMLQSLVERKLLSASQMEQVSRVLDMRLNRK